MQEKKGEGEGRESRETRWIEQLSSMPEQQDLGSRILKCALRQILFCDKCQTFPIISQPFSSWSAGPLKKVLFLLRGAQDVERP